MTTLNAFAQITSATLADPFTQFRMSGTVCIDGVGPNSPYPWTVLVPMSSSPDDVNAACIASATAAALVQGYTVTVKALISAVSEDPSQVVTATAMNAAIATAISSVPTTSAMNAAISSATSGLASASSVSAAIASATTGLATKTYVDTNDAARQALPGSGTSPTLTIGTARQPSTTRPVRVTVSGTWTTSLTAGGGISLQSDSNSTPTTIRDTQQPSVTLAVGVGITLPWKLVYDVPAGHYYRLVASGTGTFAITSTNETTT